jgi:hypothetical protein
MTFRCWYTCLTPPIPDHPILGSVLIRLYHPGPRVVPDPFTRFHGSRHVGTAAQCTLGSEQGI